MFIQSLPKESYFQLIGFGSDFKKYNEEPVIYNKENVKNIINIINNLDADLGGTNISDPLREIYNSDNVYSKINLSKNIFILTDGDVDNRDECINLIAANSNKFRIHSIGIGNYFDKILIEKCGKLGKGTSSFVENVENINSVVIDTLNKGLRPYITDIKFEFENYKEEISSSIISCNPINNFVYQNEIMNYSFILPGKKELSNLKIKITGKDPINQIENITNFDKIIKLENGDQMSKMIVGKALKNNDELVKDEKKEIEFAKKYQILSKNTALFAEILNEESQQSKLIKVNSDNSNYLGNLANSIDILDGQTGLQNPFFNNCNINYSINNYNNINNINNNNMNNFNNNNFNMNFSMNNYNNMNNNNMNIFNNNNNFNLNFSMNNYNNMNNNNMNIFNNNNNFNLNFSMNNYNNINDCININNYNNMNNCNSKYMNNNCMNNYNKEYEDDEDAEYLTNDNISNFNMNNNNMSNFNLNNNNSINCANNSNKNAFNIESSLSKGNMNANDDINLIMSQDVMEGYWDENDETKKIIDIITLDKFNKIKNTINALNKGENEIKIIYTILVIYYLKTNLSEKIKDYRLVISKANKFLEENGIDYDNIISGIS